MLAKEAKSDEEDLLFRLTETLFYEDSSESIKLTLFKKIISKTYKNYLENSDLNKTKENNNIKIVDKIKRFRFIDSQIELLDFFSDQKKLHSYKVIKHQIFDELSRLKIDESLYDELNSSKLLIDNEDILEVLSLLFINDFDPYLSDETLLQNYKTTFRFLLESLEIPLSYNFINNLFENKLYYDLISVSENSGYLYNSLDHPVRNNVNF